MEDVRDSMKAALKQAMREKDVVARDTIRMTLNAINQVEVDSQDTVDATGAMDILLKEVKKRRDAISEMKSAGRDDLVQQEETELAVIEQFLPEQMSREDLEVIVRDAILETGATEQKDMGRVMGIVMPKVKGKADGKIVNAVVREQLQG